MILHIQLFARARDLAGAETLRLELPEGATVTDLRRRLTADYPALAALLQRCAVAVDGDFAEDARILVENVQVAVLPPVSGGSMLP